MAERGVGFALLSGFKFPAKRIYRDFPVLKRDFRVARWWLALQHADARADVAKVVILHLTTASKRKAKCNPLCTWPATGLPKNTVRRSECYFLCSGLRFNSLRISGDAAPSL